MLTICTKNVHFRYNRKIFVQTDGVAMGSPLQPVLADIFMTELEKTLLLFIHILYIQFWRRYVDYTISYVKIGSIKHMYHFCIVLMKTYNLNLSLRTKVHYYFLMCYYAETVENLQQQFTERKLTVIFI